LESFQRLPLDTLKLFLHDGYKPNREAHRGPVRQLWQGQASLSGALHAPGLDVYAFEVIPSVRKLCRRLERRQYTRDICEFNGDRTPKHNTFSLFVKRAKPITYIVRAANINDKDLVKLLMKLASSLLKRYGKRISHIIADNQYYSAEVFKTIREFGAEPIIPHPLNVKDPLINLYITKRFKVKGDPRLAMHSAHKALVIIINVRPQL